MKILLATDGSESARLAVDFLIRFPFPASSSATVLTVIDTRAFTDYDTAADINADQGRLLRETEQDIREDGERLIASEAARLQEAGWAVSTEILTGDPAEEIIQAAEENKPDLIVVGSHGMSGVKRFLLGSVSDRVLEHACCSVLIVKPSPQFPAKKEDGEKAQPWRILLAYDDSGPARKAVSLCASLPMDDKAEITAVSVMPMIHMYRQDIRQQLNSIWQQKRDAMEAALKDAVNTPQWSTPHVSTELLESTDVSQELLDTAARKECNLVVLGYKGKGAIKRFLLGSITSRIAHHAPCSVLAVRN